MSKRKRKIFRWIRWVLLGLILLPVVSMILIKLTGTLKMRKPDDQILGALHSFYIDSRIDTAWIGNRRIVFLKTSKGGQAKDDAIIFVHGSPGSLDNFLSFMHHDSLLSRADLISYDRPGFGHSDFGNALPSLRGQAILLKDLMDYWGYKRYWLAGHSYGSSVILQAAMDHPQRIAGLVFISGSVIYELEPAANWRKWLNLPFIRVIMPTALRVSNDELIALRRDLRMIDDDWAQINVPVTLIHGSKDMLVPFGNLIMAEEKLSSSDTVLTCVFEDENHFIIWTKAEEIALKIDGMLKRVN